MSKCSNCQIDCTMDSVVSVQGDFIKCGKCTVKEQQAEIARLTAELAAMKDWEITLAKYAERANHWEQEARKISLAYDYAEATIAKREAELAALKSQEPAAQGEQEPVAHIRTGFILEWVAPHFGLVNGEPKQHPDGTLLYAAPPLREGWVSVPRIATAKMCEAYYDLCRKENTLAIAARDIYKAMIAASEEG